jgi:hypothetical protein
MSKLRRAGATSAGPMAPDYVARGTPFTVSDMPSGRMRAAAAEPSAKANRDMPAGTMPEPVSADVSSDMPGGRMTAGAAVGASSSESAMPTGSMSSDERSAAAAVGAPRSLEVGGEWRLTLSVTSLNQGPRA